MGRLFLSVTKNIFFSDAISVDGTLVFSSRIEAKPDGENLFEVLIIAFAEFSSVLRRNESAGIVYSAAY